MMQSLSIHNLFGLFDYDIQFKEVNGENIRFITGPNGYGKTTILNLIDAILSQDWDFLTFSQYSLLRFCFSDGTVSVERTQLENTDSSIDISFSKSIELHVSLLDNDGQPVAEFHRKHKDGNNEDLFSGKYKGDLSLFLSKHKESLFYIRDNRMFADNGDAIIANNTDLIKRMNETADAIHKILQSPYDLTQDYTELQFKSDTDCLKPFADKLFDYGLTDIKWPDFDNNNPSKTKNITHAFRLASTSLSDFVERLDLFVSLIEKCRFTNKQLHLTRENGYFFILDNTGQPLPELNKLSSGEQHVMIQFYEMLFKTEKGGLVLIDEPEMSFHLAWQIHYMKNIRSICQRRKLQCIVATHSTQVFERKWDCVSDLYRLTHPELVKK